jgi:hypothetical protein
MPVRLLNSRNNCGITTFNRLPCICIPGGFSLLLAMATDVLVLATVHIYALYSQFAWLHSLQLTVLASLWKLFRGKKKNVLRNRVDSIDFDLAQLLLGTMLFVVVFFLFPTTLVYYCFFLVVWLAIACVRATLWWLITVVNSMPAFTLFTLLALPPSRAPSGVLLHRIFGQCAQRETCIDNELRRNDHYPIVWFELLSAASSPAVALAPYAEALRILLQRYSFGTVIKSALWGGASVFPASLSAAPRLLTSSYPIPAGLVPNGAPANGSPQIAGLSNDFLQFSHIRAYWYTMWEVCKTSLSVA